MIYFRHDDLKQMLDSNKDNLKLEAMRRIIGVRENKNSVVIVKKDLNLDDCQG